MVRIVLLSYLPDNSDAPQHDKDEHGNHKKPTDRDVISILPLVGDSSDEKKEFGDEGEEM